jgi:hypothetical protein
MNNNVRVSKIVFFILILVLVKFLSIFTYRHTKLPWGCKLSEKK